MSSSSAGPDEEVRHFLSAGLGMPTVMVAAMRFMPGWSKMKRLAKTLPYDLDIMQGTQEGTPLPSDRWQNVAAPTLVLTGEKSDSFLRRGAEQLVDRLPSARHQTIKGANHAAVVAAPKSLAAELGSFFRE